MIILYTVNLSTGTTRSALCSLRLYKNGAEYKRINNVSTGRHLGGSAIVDMNVATDYVEVFVFPATDNFVLDIDAAMNVFQGVLVSFNRS